MQVSRVEMQLFSRKRVVTQTASRNLKYVLRSKVTSEERLARDRVKQCLDKSAIQHASPVSKVL